MTWEDFEVVSIKKVSNYIFDHLPNFLELFLPLFNQIEDTYMHKNNSAKICPRIGRVDETSEWKQPPMKYAKGCKPTLHGFNQPILRSGNHCCEKSAGFVWLEKQGEHFVPNHRHEYGSTRPWIEGLSWIQKN